MSTKQVPSSAQLLAEYAAFPSDQDVNETYAAARLGLSTAWLQWKRCAGGGPKFQRTPTGKIRYRKADIEEFRDSYLTPHSSTSEYKAA
jgi:hypothetical protein